MEDVQNAPTYRDPELLLEGVDAQKHADAERELQQFIRTITKGSPHPLLAIVITEKFPAAVQSIRKFGIKELRDSPYEQYRSHSVAVAKTMPCLIDGGLGFVVVFDSQAFDLAVFKNWAPEYAGVRQYYTAHELVHIADMHLEAVAIGVERFMDSARWSEDRKLLNAGAFWQEYHAVRFVAESAQPRDFEKALGYEDAFAKLLNDLPEFLNAHIKSFRWWRLTVEQYLEKVGARLRQVFVLWAYMIALEDAGVSLPKPYTNTKAYEVVLKSLEREIRAVLQRMYADQWKYQPIELEKLGDTIDRALEKCSLKFRPMMQKGYLYAEVLDVEF